MKLKSFTLTELIMAMLLSSIIIGMSYLSLTLIIKQMVLYKKNNNEQIDFVLLQQALRQDIAFASVVFATDTSLQCITPLGVVAYHFKEGDTIVRVNEDLHTNLFNLITTAKIYKYQQKPAYKGVIDAGKLNIQVNKEELPICFYKPYIASSYMRFPTYFSTP